jgi:hypothetical protein
MSIHYSLLLAQSVIPGGADSNSSIDNIIGIFAKKSNVDPNSIAGALDDLWNVSMEGTMYQIIGRLGVLIAVIAVGSWCVNFYRTLEKGDARLTVNDVVWPVIIVFMLSNGAVNMRVTTMGARDMMNGVNRSINTVINSEINLTAARQVLGFADVSNLIVDNLVSACKSQTELDKLKECLRAKEQVANGQIRGMEGKLLNFSYNPTGGSNSAKWQTQVEKWKQHVQDYSKNRFDINNLIPEAGKDGKTDITQITGFDDTEQLRRVILSFRGSFLYIIEVMMLVTGLIGPIPLALSMFPIGTKPLVAWATSFLSLGFCKICFTLISGLSSLAMVYSEPNNVDMLVASVVLGLLAPILAFSLASGAGLSALSNISYSAQGFKMNSGIGLYNPGSGQGSSENNRPPNEGRYD